MSRKTKKPTPTATLIDEVRMLSDRVLAIRAATTEIQRSVTIISQILDPLVKIVKGVDVRVGRVEDVISERSRVSSQRIHELAAQVASARVKLDEIADRLPKPKAKKRRAR